MVERVLEDDLRGRGPSFTGPGRYVFPMFLFVMAVGALVFFLATSSPVVTDAFFANVYINGAIVGVLFVGVAYTFHQTLGVRPAVSWLRELSEYRDLRRMRPPPALIAPMALISGDAGGRPRVTPQEAKSILDSVGARMSEAGELTRYFARLLIFLGLLGTFWGLLQTVGSLVTAVGALSDSAGDGAVDQIFTTINEPLQGMGTAFSSSIFGLAGSLVLGFLDLQATQAQNRFYTEAEDWMLTITRVAPSGIEAAANAGSFDTALVSQTAESLDKLSTIVARIEDGRERSNEALTELAAQLRGLNDRLGRQEESIIAIKERALDDSLPRYTRSIDVTLQRLSDQLLAETAQSNQELRGELRTLTRAITAALESAARGQRG